jgi:hypothetical protein
MIDRVYVLLDVKEDKFDQALLILRGKTGVRMLDVLEGRPNVIMMIQAHDRQLLAKLAIEALTSVESMTEDHQLLPVQDGCNTSVLTKPLRTKSLVRKEKPGNNGQTSGAK